MQQYIDYVNTFQLILYDITFFDFFFLFSFFYVSLFLTGWNTISILNLLNYTFE